MRSGWNPIAVEAGWNTVRDMYRGDGGIGKVPGVQDNEVGRVMVRVDDKTHQPAVIFRGCGAARDKHELAGSTTGAEIMDLPGAGFEIMLVQAGREMLAEALFGQRHRIAVAIGLAETPFIGARKFLWGTIDHPPIDAATDRIDTPPFQLYRL